MVFLQNWPFYHLFLLVNLGQENVFYDILERKNTFAGFKKRSSKSRKIEIFPKGLVRGLVQTGLFFHFSFRQSRPEKYVL